MNRWLELVFPEYCPPRFDRLLTNLRRPNGRHQVQIFVGLIDKQVAGFYAVFYRKWRGGLLADIDLLGVMEPYRRTGLASALVQQSLQATGEIAQQYRAPAIGMVTLADPQYVPIIKLHQKLGGHIRSDYQYPSGDIIVWYPMQQKYEDIPTRILGEQLRLFGKILEN